MFNLHFPVSEESALDIASIADNKILISNNYDSTTILPSCAKTFNRNFNTLNGSDDDVISGSSSLLLSSQAPGSLITPPPKTAICDEKFSDRSSSHYATSNYSKDHIPKSPSLSQSVFDLKLRGRRTGFDKSLPLSVTVQDPDRKKSPLMTPRSFPSIQSPCFYHQRFDDVLNIDRLLESIQESQFLSHSRLMATATGVREISKQLQLRPIKRDVKNVMIITKARDNNLVTLTKELSLWLMSKPRYGSDLGVNVYVDAKLEKSKRFGVAEILELNPRYAKLLKYWKPDMCQSKPELFDLVITLGGDGTVLFTSWLFQRIVPPILSFSLGSLGFLTNFEYDRFKEHLDKVMGDEGMRVSMRMRFTCTINKKNSSHISEETEQYEVLNELVIDRGPSPYVSNLELYGEEELLTVIQADGCIFATPTGSTAYSLSAGGSLVHPDIPGILLTPICPHSLSFRPMILSDTLLLRVAIPHNSRATAYCSFDGKGRVELKQGDSITIAASQYPFPTVMRSSSEWFDSVSTSLKWNNRGAAQKGWTGNEGVKDDETQWDIDFDDSAYGTSVESSVVGSPVKKKMILF